MTRASRRTASSSSTRRTVSEPRDAPTASLDRSIELDKAAKHPDPAERQAADDLVSLMTPIVKAMFTDNGLATANLGMQVMGGHGYIREWGMEQLVRDCRITLIYEGTNGIQALDLVGRKLPAHMGRLLRSFFHPVDAYIRARLEKPELAEFVLPLAKAWNLISAAPARAAGLSDRGILAEGYRADILLVDDALPLRPRIVAVIAAGRLVHLTDASRLLRSPAARREAVAVA